MNILVTGGAGYIGSITANQLQTNGHRVVVLDSFVKGDRERVRPYEVVEGWTTDKELVAKVLADYQIEAVVHFAAYIEAGESMQDPGKYFYNNVYGSMQLVHALLEANVKRLVFSSTAAVYGIPETVPIIETAVKAPVNAYGESKLMVERMLDWYSRIHDLRSIVLRYFNASGALLDGSLGEAHTPETHLIPNLLQSILDKRAFSLFGDDYKTPDGTCIRDYIHVLDLANAHVVALQALAAGHAGNTYNIGTGHGYSNRKVLAMVETITKQPVQLQVKPRRPGDPDQLVADSSKFATEFGWQPQYSDLQTIIDSAWKWHDR